jgi:hypothetical protein
VSAAQQQAVTSLLAALVNGHATIGSDGGVLFDVLDGAAAELVLDHLIDDNTVDATIWTDDEHGDPIEVATVRLTVAVIA